MSTAIVNKTDEDNLSSSPLLNDPAVKKIYDAAAALSADEAHHALLGSYVAFGESAIAYAAYVLDVRRRMHNGEKVGGYTVWTDYADLYLRQADESLPTCMRRLRRMLEGKNPDTKHVTKRSRQKLFAKKNAELVADGLEAAHQTELEEVAQRNFAEGEAAGMKKQAMIAASKTTEGADDQARTLADKLAFAVVYQTPRNKVTNKIRKMALDYMKLRGIHQFDEPEPEPEPTDAPTVQPEPPKPKTKQSKNEKKLEAVIDELRRIDSILEVAPVDNEFGAYVDKSNYKLLDKQERLKKKLELLEKAVEAEESDDQPSKETEEKMQARLHTEYEAEPL